jgi:RNA polymerase sigma-70 factor (ECF subfamily)
VDPSGVNGLLAKARQGDAAALGILLEKYRDDLTRLAHRQLDSQVKVRAAPSDVVQQTCFEAYRDFEAFRGQNKEEFIGWLRRILANNVAETIEYHVLTQKRRTGKEVSLDDSKRFGHRLRENLAADQSSPSKQARRGEAAVELAAAIDALPENQRRAVRLRYMEGCSLAQIARRLDSTEAAAAGLLKRALLALRKQFVELPY